MRNEIALTDEEIDAVWDDQFNIADYMEFESSFTRDTLEQFLEARKNWEDWGTLFQGKTDIGNHPFIEIERCQALKGQPSQTVRVIDFGSVRAIYAS
jgi:hypothetical protein